MSNLGKRLIKSAKEARKVARGKADPASYKLHIPASIDASRNSRKVKPRDAGK